VSHDSNVGSFVRLGAARTWDKFGQIWHEDRAILEEPEVVGLTSLGPGGITLRLLAKTKPLEQWRSGRLLRERIKQELDQEGIDLPPPRPWTAPDQPTCGQGSQAVVR